MVDAARNRLIDSAIRLIRKQTVAGTTVADLLAASGVARRSLYINFPGGREEVLAEAASRAGRTRPDEVNAMLAASPHPARAIEAFIAMLRKGLVATDYVVGCPVVASALAGHGVPEARRNAGETFTLWCAEIADGLESHGVDARRAVSLAHLVVSAVEGATVLAIGTRSTDPLSSIADELGPLIEAAVTPA